jgi:hypothetical protein
MGHLGAQCEKLAQPDYDDGPAALPTGVCFSSTSLGCESSSGGDLTHAGALSHDYEVGHSPEHAFREWDDAPTNEHHAGVARARAPVGVSFHVGSQQRDVNAWDEPLDYVSGLYAAMRDAGFDPAGVNVGGGLPCA